MSLDLGGLALQVTTATGIKIPAISPDQSVHGLAAGLRTLAQNPTMLQALGENARSRASRLSWDRKVETFWDILEQDGIAPQQHRSYKLSPVQ